MFDEMADGEGWTNEKTVTLLPVNKITTKVGSYSFYEILFTLVE